MSSIDPILAATEAAKHGYTPLGPRRSVFANMEPLFTATTQGANYSSKLARSIFVDAITVSMGIRATNNLPVGVTQVEVLGLISWAEGPTLDSGAAPYYPTALFKNDSTFGTQVFTGNPNSNGGTQWAENFLWGHIMKAFLNASGDLAGEFGVHNTVYPLQYIPEAASITLHMDEDMSAAVNLDGEMVATIYYTPVKTVKVTR